MEASAETRQETDEFSCHCAAFGNLCISDTYCDKRVNWKDSKTLSVSGTLVTGYCRELTP